jgi:hypothetical protein|tara:strand:+ start:171 stop:653 length:483 start_codon:yes stop_codon:yes gene_type:complete
MKLQELKSRLNLYGQEHNVLLKLEDGSIIPPYFHITEMGLKIKHFVDCGGELRTEQYVTFQVWTADDFDHRITAGKVLDIIEKGEKIIGAVDLELEIEYQTNTIGSYSLEYTNEPLVFILKSKKTNCLAPDKCGIEKPKQSNPSCCTKPNPNAQGAATCC